MARGTERKLREIDERWMALPPDVRQPEMYRELGLAARIDEEALETRVKLLEAAIERYEIAAEPTA